MDLMQRCLSFDLREDLPTAVEALDHPYVAMFRDPPSIADRTVQMVIDDNTRNIRALPRAPRLDGGHLR